MSGTGTQISRSRRGRALVSTTSTGRSPPRKRATSRERSRRRREPDALRIARGRRSDALERERQVRAALGRGERVDLVDDHRLDAAQRLALGGAEDQVERLGRGDEDLGGIARLRRALARGRVAGAHGDARNADLQTRASPPRAARRPAARAGCARCRRPAPSAARRRARARRAGGVSASARARRSMPHRNAASVLPLPVGAISSACSPPAMRAQPLRLHRRRRARSWPRTRRARRERRG